MKVKLPMFGMSSFENDTNPHYFTVDTEEGGYSFFRGRHKMFLTHKQVSHLINSNDFYENVNTMMSISINPEEFAQELVEILASSGRFIKTHRAYFNDGCCHLEFELDLDRHDLTPVNGRWDKYKDSYDVWLSVNVGDVNDFQGVVTELLNRVDRALTSNFFEPNLDD